VFTHRIQVPWNAPPTQLLQTARSGSPFPEFDNTTKRRLY
jgi:hypothetical protein